MRHATANVHVRPALADRLESLGRSLHRSKDKLAEEAIERFLESEEEIIADIKEAQAQLDAGLGIPHADMMRKVREIVEAAEAKERA